MADRLVSLLEAAPGHRPAAIEGDVTLSYAQLRVRVRAMARALVARGIRAGDRVAVLAHPGIFSWSSFLATASIGGVWLGLNPRYRLAELRAAIDDARPSLLLALPRGSDLSLADLATLACADMTMLAGDSDLDLMSRLVDATATPDDLLDQRVAATSGDQPCLIVYTSGSTGRPKGALLHQRGISRFAQTQNQLWPVSDFRILNFLPINHIGNLVDIGAAALAAGGAQIFESRFCPAGSLQTMAQQRVTIWGSVPSVFRMQLDLPDFASVDLSALELIVWGGAAMPAPLLPRLVALCPRLATNYGMTETSSAITSLGPTDNLVRLAESVGTPFPGVEVRIDADSGEILARSDLNFCGYWQNEAATRAAFTHDGFFRTGDVGTFGSDGTLRLIGRVKSMFKSGGYNIWPAEIERVLSSHPDVVDCAVVPAPDPLWQEVGTAFVVAEKGLSADGLRAWCRAHLANYKVPKNFVLMDSLPLLPVGKTDRQALVAIARENAAAC